MTEEEQQKRFLEEAPRIRRLYQDEDFQLFLEYVSDQIGLIKDQLATAGVDAVPKLQGEILGLSYCIKLEKALEDKLEILMNSERTSDERGREGAD